MTDVKRSLKQLELAELARLAEAATPGPWECYGSTSNGGKTYAAVKLTRHPTTPHKTLSCDALFQAAANPEAVLGLIARIEKLEAALQSISNHASDPFAWWVREAREALRGES